MSTWGSNNSNNKTSAWGSSSSSSSSNSTWGGGSGSNWNGNSKWNSVNSYGSNSNSSTQKQGFANQKTFGGKKQHGGWGVKVQPKTSGLGTSGFGSSGFGTSGFGSGFGSSGSAFGNKTGFGTSNTGFGQKQEVQVPITTKGFPFKVSIQEEGQERAKILYNAKHICVLEMFQNFTIDELRMYDYIKTGKISPTWATTGTTGSFNTQTSNAFSTTKQSTFGTGFGQQSVEKVPKQWYNIPVELWKQIPDFSQKKTEEKEPEKSKLTYSLIYGDLPQNKYTTLTDKSEIEIPPPLENYTLKGFNKTGTIEYQLSQRVPISSKSIGAEKLASLSSSNIQATTTTHFTTRSTTSTSKHTGYVEENQLVYYPFKELNFTQNNPFIVSFHRILKFNNEDIEIYSNMTFMFDFHLEDEESKKLFNITLKLSEQNIILIYNINEEYLPKEQNIMIESNVQESENEHIFESDVIYDEIQSIRKPMIVNKNKGSIVLIASTSDFPISINYL